MMGVKKYFLSQGLGIGDFLFYGLSDISTDIHHIDAVRQFDLSIMRLDNGVCLDFRKHHSLRIVGTLQDIHPMVDFQVQGNCRISLAKRMLPQRVTVFIAVLLIYLFHEPQERRPAFGGVLVHARVLQDSGKDLAGFLH